LKEARDAKGGEIEASCCEKLYYNEPAESSTKENGKKKGQTVGRATSGKGGRKKKHQSRKMRKKTKRTQELQKKKKMGRPRQGRKHEGGSPEGESKPVLGDFKVVEKRKKKEGEYGNGRMNE